MMVHGHSLHGNTKSQTNLNKNSFFFITTGKYDFALLVKLGMFRNPTLFGLEDKHSPLAARQMLAEGEDCVCGGQGLIEWWP